MSGASLDKPAWGSLPVKGAKRSFYPWLVGSAGMLMSVALAAEWWADQTRGKRHRLTEQAMGENRLFWLVPTPSYK